MQYMTNKLTKNLELYRLENKIPLKQLAELLDVNYTTIYRWFSNKAQPNKIQTFHIHKLLGKQKNG